MAESLQVRSEFIFETAPFRACHASTLVELPDGELLSAWFAGGDEGQDDVEIWVSRRPAGGRWSPPEVVTHFPDSPCWNPVLFLDPAGDLRLYFKVGPSPQNWVGAFRSSRDSGRTWTPVEYLPAGLLGPIRNKPLLLSDGTILSGSSVEAGYRRDTPREAPYRSWAVWVERSTDGGTSWTKQGPISVPGEPFGVIQPTLWQTGSGHVKMLMRSTQRIGFVCESTSGDGGLTWTPARPVASLPNPNSALDAVKLKDGQVALVYNHTQQGRSPIHLALSPDDGETWGPPFVLEEGAGEFSYPAVIQTQDGTLHVTYTWKRVKIRHLEIDPLPSRETSAIP